MSPNFPDAEYLLTEKVTYYLRNPIRGDVVVFTPPISNTDEYIKRVIGLPGEKLMLRGGHVYINGKLLSETYLASTLQTDGGTFLGDEQEYTVPAGLYFVMGDNRTNSSDSRYWGPITKAAISGRAWVIYWPINLSGVVQTPKYNI